MCCYLLSANAYATFARLLKYHYFDLDLQYILLKYESKFTDVQLIKENRADLEKVSNFLVVRMIVANARNVDLIRSDFDFTDRLPTTEQLATDYLSSGFCNHQWLGSVETSKQLIVKAFDWYLSQSIDTQSDAPICKLIEEVNGKYAIEIVKQMPGACRIPSVHD